jgi:uncharacterized protein
MIVVSDTSALTALLQVNRIELLVQIYEEVFIPQAVRDELLRTHPVLPAFLQCRPVADTAQVARISTELDRGESEAIVLAKELRADDLLIDEARGREVARREGVHVIGLLGVLLEAKGRRLISSVRELTAELERRAGFFVSENVRETIFRAAGE